MPTKVVYALVLSTLLILQACSGSKTAKAQPDQSQARKDRIIANLQEAFPPLEDLTVTLGDIEPGPGNLEKVEMTIVGPRGIQSQTLFIDPKEQQLYIVAAEPIDISKTAQELQTAREQRQKERMEALTRLAQQAPARGPAGAPVTIYEFTDFQCPFCKRASDTIEELMDKYPEQVKLVFMNYPLPFHPWANAAAIAAVCAQNQKEQAFWKLYDAYFTNQEQIDSENLISKSREYLSGTGIDLERWSKCASDESSEAYQEAAARVETQMETGSELGVEGTPAFFIGGRLLQGALPMEEFDQAVQDALKQKGR